MRCPNALGLCLLLSTVSLAPAPAFAQDAIKIAYIGPQTGPLAAFSVIGQGMKAYFDKINEEDGGVDGHTLEVVTKDDAYDPAKSAPAAPAPAPPPAPGPRDRDPLAVRPAADWAPSPNIMRKKSLKPAASPAPPPDVRNSQRTLPL